MFKSHFQNHISLSKNEERILKPFPICTSMFECLFSKSFPFKVGTSDIWFQSMTSSSSDLEGSDSESEALDDDPDSEVEAPRHIEKSFFFSVEDVQYNRDVSPMIPFPNATSSERSSPTHILTVNGAKGAWTQSNRDMAFSLYDSW